MNYDIFFISYEESNADENWQRVLSFHPEAKRINKVVGINNAHLMCNELCNTNKFWTIDGDNWLLNKLTVDDLILSHMEDLIYFNSIDVVDGTISSSGGIKLWTKNKIINDDMSKGDFSKFATKNSVVIQKTLSEHRYNHTAYEAWRHTFRHMVKCFSGIINKNVLEKNIELIEKHQSLNLDSYLGYLTAKDYVDQCGNNFDKINLINNYDWLKDYYNTNVCVVDGKKP